jgi:hypothetical protein
LWRGELEAASQAGCDEQLAGSLRAELAQGTGYDHFEFNLFDLEPFYGESRLAIREAEALGYEDAEVTLHGFLAAIPEVPPAREIASSTPDF